MNWKKYVVFEPNEKTLFEAGQVEHRWTTTVYEDHTDEVTHRNGILALTNSRLIYVSTTPLFVYAMPFDQISRIEPRSYKVKGGLFGSKTEHALIIADKDAPYERRFILKADELEKIMMEIKKLREG
mgnify:CR=1 FL=1